MVAKPEFWGLQNGSEAQAQGDTHVEWFVCHCPGRLLTSLDARFIKPASELGRETARPSLVKVRPVLITTMDGKGQGSLLLLLLMSDLLLCNSVASQPFCANGAGCRLSLRELFDRAIILSHYIHSLSSEIVQEFDAQYSQGPGFFTQAISMCHTASISTPAGKEQAQQIHQKDFVILVIHLLRSWTEPLNHLITEASRLPKAPDALIAKAMEIQEQNQRLLEGLKKIGKLVDPEITDNGDYAVWLGLPSLQSDDLESLLFAYHNMFRCLRRDTHKVDNYLKFLKCQIAYGGSC
ncbi:prolactin [Erethizon dorsatum]